jgi:peptidoglycan hydrolase-like protein with peptidoglycan-binding domain
MPPETPPDMTTGNPFSLIAYLLFRVRHSLEDIEEPGRPPRWIRIARARQATAPTDYIAIGVRGAIDGFAEALSYMVELTLDIQEVLVQTDAAKALVEVSADFLKAATSDNFVNGVRAVVGQPPGGNPLSNVGGILDSIKQYMGYIPDPDDVHTLGEQLYRLLCVEQLPLPRKDNGLEMNEAALPASIFEHVDVDKSGKVRLLQWAFNHDLTTFGLGDKQRPEEESQALVRYGSRRLWQASDPARLPVRTAWHWGTAGNKELIYEFFFDDREQTEAHRTLDIRETYALLEKMGYTTPAAPQKTVFGEELTQRLRNFQAINDLPLSGELDSATLNRLLHLDFIAKNIRRAKPYDPTRLPAGIEVKAPGAPRYLGGFFKLINPGAEHPEEQGLRFLTTPGHGRYPYYQAGALLPPTGPAPVPPQGGWISDSGTGVVQGFVAMRSRYTTQDENRLEGGILSEGEAATGGNFFFAARFTEPWVAGRRGEPGNDSLFGRNKPAPGSVARMYQWIPLDKLDRPAGWDLYVTASVLRRSLYEERSRTTHQPDQGTIGLEFYGADYFEGKERKLGTRRDPSAQSEELRAASRFAPVYPEIAPSAAQLTPGDVARKRLWMPQSVPHVLVPPSAVAMLVILEGHYQAGWDIDAYFDEVLVSWTFHKKAA